MSRLSLLVLTLCLECALKFEQFFLVLLDFGCSRPRPRRSDDGRGEVTVLLRRLACEDGLGGEVAEHRRVQLLQPFGRLDALLFRECLVGGFLVERFQSGDFIGRVLCRNLVDVCQ